MLFRCFERWISGIALCLKRGLGVLRCLKFIFFSPWKLFCSLCQQAIFRVDPKFKLWQEEG